MKKLQFSNKSSQDVIFRFSLERNLKPEFQQSFHFVSRFIDCCSLADFLASMKSDSPNEIFSPMSESGSNNAVGSLMTKPSLAPGILIDSEKTFSVTLKSDSSYSLSCRGEKRLCSVAAPGHGWPLDDLFAFWDVLGSGQLLQNAFIC